MQIYQKFVRSSFNLNTDPNRKTISRTRGLSYFLVQRIPNVIAAWASFLIDCPISIKQTHSQFHHPDLSALDFFFLMSTCGNGFPISFAFLLISLTPFGQHRYVGPMPLDDTSHYSKIVTYKNGFRTNSQMFTHGTF